MKLVIIFTLLKKEFLLEWRQKVALGSLVVNVIATTFFIYMIFNGDITFKVWLALFWTINLFSVIQSASRTFVKDANEHFYYLKSLASSTEIIIAKIIYNTLLICTVALLVYLIMYLFFEQSVQYIMVWLATLFIAGLGFSSIFTLLSAISAKTNNVVLLGVLGLPIVLPLILIISKLSMYADFYTTLKDVYIFIGAGLTLDGMIIILAISLFPYLWKE